MFQSHFFGYQWLPAISILNWDESCCSISKQCCQLLSILLLHFQALLSILLLHFQAVLSFGAKFELIPLALLGVYSQPSLISNQRGCIPIDTSTLTNSLFSLFPLFFLLFSLFSLCFSVTTLLLGVSCVVSIGQK
jgi:hypothetical protein